MTSYICWPQLLYIHLLAKVEYFLYFVCYCAISRMDIEHKPEQDVTS